MSETNAHSRLRIVSDGTANNTVVHDADGEPVKWGRAALTRVDILPISANATVTAVLTVEMVGLDLYAATALREQIRDRLSGSAIRTPGAGA